MDRHARSWALAQQSALRCACILATVDAGHDLATAQQLAGHASQTTTARYGRRGGRARARATADLRFPLPGGHGDHRS